MKILKLFEAFNRDKIELLINNGETYVFKKIRDFLIKNNNRYSYLVGLLRHYDFSKFSYKQTGIQVEIIPDIGYMDLYKELCDLTSTLDDVKSQIFNIDLKFYLTIRDGIASIDFVKGKLNLIDFPDGLPDILVGTSLGYNLYKLIINNNDYISSNKYSEKAAYNLWYNLLQDDKLYGITSNSISVVIKKNISNDRLVEILDIFPKDLEYDDELKQKIIEIYGSMDAYTQGN